jgi:hypothetical protein
MNIFSPQGKYYENIVKIKNQKEKLALRPMNHYL